MGMSERVRQSPHPNKAGITGSVKERKPKGERGESQEGTFQGTSLDH